MGHTSEQRSFQHSSFFRALTTGILQKGFIGLHRTKEPQHQAVETTVHPISYSTFEVSSSSPVQ
jgi:hypothetical protein